MHIYNVSESLAAGGRPERNTPEVPAAAKDSRVTTVTVYISTFRL